jgi:RNA polymerase sigma-70 factor, ECF subfamily
MQAPCPGPDTEGRPPNTARAFVALLPDLRRSARRLSRSVEDADDLVQETLLRVWSRLAMARAGASDAAPISDLRAYAFATLRNCARTRGRSAVAGESAGDAEEVPDASADPEADLAAGRALAALDDLPRAQGALLRMRAFEGLSYAEIAAATGLPMGTVTSRLSRARRALRRRLGAEGNAADPPGDGPGPWAGSR